MREDAEVMPPAVVSLTDISGHVMHRSIYTARRMPAPRPVATVSVSIIIVALALALALAFTTSTLSHSKLEATDK